MVRQDIFKVDKTIENISVGETTEISFGDTDTCIDSIKITAADDLNGAIITVERLMEKPTDVIKPTTTNVYTYLNIESTAPEGSIGSLTIKFKVEKTWLTENNIDKNNVVLMRYHNGIWEQLDTTVLNEDTTHVNYQATTTGLSIFAIAVGESSEKPSELQIPLVFITIIIVLVIIVLSPCFTIEDTSKVDFSSFSLLDGNLVWLRDAYDRFDTIQFILYVLVAALFFILPSFSVIYTLNLPSKIQFTESSMSCRFSFDKPILSEVVFRNQIYTQIIMEKCFSQASVGDPALPVFPANLLLPDGSVIDDIHISYQKSVLLDYDFTNKPVMPQQEYIPLSADTEFISFEMNESAYESVAYLPGPLFEIGEIGFCRGFAILTVYLFPVRYVPTKGHVYYFPEITVTVDLKESIDAPLNAENPPASL